MDRLIQFLLRMLFLITPVIYAWLYIPGMEGNLSDIYSWFFWENLNGFEGVKVTFFLWIVAVAVLAFVIKSISQKAITAPTKWFLYVWAGLLIWTIVSLLLSVNLNTNPYFAFGTLEKHHGWFMYVGLFALYFLVKNQNEKEQKKLLWFSIMGYGIVCLYAIFQVFWWDPLQSLYESRLARNRIFTTLGNPNYFAGLILMMIPLILWKIQNGGIIILIISGIFIYLTGSYLAWGIFAGYIFMLMINVIFRTPISRRIFWWMFFVVFAVWVMIFWKKYGSEILEMQKVKWFIARWYLWQTGLNAIKYDPLYTLFWYGPDGFLAVSEKFRHPLLSTTYEDPAYRIDSSHNFFIDFAIQFGVPMLAVLMYWIVKIWKRIPVLFKQSLILFALYFFFNIPVLVHYILLIQIFSLQKFDK